MNKEFTDHLTARMNESMDFNIRFGALVHLLLLLRDADYHYKKCGCDPCKEKILPNMKVTGMIMKQIESSDFKEDFWKIIDVIAEAESEHREKKMAEYFVQKKPKYDA